MNYFKLLLLLNGALSVSGTCFSAAAAKEGKEEASSVSLDEAVLVSEGELKNRTFSYGDEKIKFSPELYQLSRFMKILTEDRQAESLEIGELRNDYYIQTLGTSLQEIHELLSAVQEGRLQDYLLPLPMEQLFKRLELSSYLHVINGEKDITEVIADYIVEKTIQATLPDKPIEHAESLVNRAFTHVAIHEPIRMAGGILFPRLNRDLEKLLKQKFEKKRFDLVKQRAVLSDNTGWVASVAFSPDGKRIASGSYDWTVRIWNTETGQELRTLNGHTDLVTSVAFSPDGTQLASGSWDSTVHIWDIPSANDLLAKMYALAENQKPLAAEFASSSSSSAAAASSNAPKKYMYKKFIYKKPIRV